MKWLPFCSRARLIFFRNCRIVFRINSWNSGYHVFIMTTQSTDVEKTLPIQYATTLVLLLLTFTLNFSAIALRARLQRRRVAA